MGRLVGSTQTLAGMAGVSKKFLVLLKGVSTYLSWEVQVGANTVMK